MSKYIRVLTILFDTPISFKEIPLFRGAILNTMGDKAHLLYHNHTSGDTFRYAYPLVQYKRVHGNAAIVCIEEGADVIGEFMSESNGTIRLGKRLVHCDINKIAPVKILVQTWNTSFFYHISNWLPLNAKNYQLYKMADDESKRKALLEGILKANLLSMLKGLNIYLEDELMLRITHLSDSFLIYNKGIAMMAFNAYFYCNLSIPNNVGIGKNASIGCGIVHQARTENEENKNT